MKKVVLVLSLLFLTSCSFSSIWNQQTVLEKPIGNKIAKQGSYWLSCKTYDHIGANMDIDYVSDPKVLFEVFKGHESGVIHVDGNSAKYSDRNYDVLYDTELQLALARQSSTSKFMEVIFINKRLGIGFGTKALSEGRDVGPYSEIYVLGCVEA